MKTTQPPTSPALVASVSHDLLSRPDKVLGATYKLRWMGTEHAFYITVNDVEDSGSRRPVEVFINSKNLEHYPRVVALTRMVSAVFRRGGDVSFVAEELKQVFDPRGGQWSNGRYVPSLVAVIGDIIERHMRAIGFLGTEDAGPALPQPAESTPTDGIGFAGPVCPRCNQPGLLKEAGCLTCVHCGWSKCS